MVWNLFRFPLAPLSHFRTQSTAIDATRTVPAPGYGKAIFTRKKRLAAFVAPHSSSIPGLPSTT